MGHARCRASLPPALCLGREADCLWSDLVKLQNAGMVLARTPQCSVWAHERLVSGCSGALLSDGGAWKGVVSEGGNATNRRYSFTHPCAIDFGRFSKVPSVGDGRRPYDDVSKLGQQTGTAAPSPVSFGTGSPSQVRCPSATGTLHQTTKAARDTDKVIWTKGPVMRQRGT